MTREKNKAVTGAQDDARIDRSFLIIKPQRNQHGKQNADHAGYCTGQPACQLVHRTRTPRGKNYEPVRGKGFIVIGIAIDGGEKILFAF